MLIIRANTLIIIKLIIIKIVFYQVPYNMKKDEGAKPLLFNFKI